MKSLKKLTAGLVILPPQDWVVALVLLFYTKNISISSYFSSSDSCPENNVIKYCQLGKKTNFCPVLSCWHIISDNVINFFLYQNFCLGMFVQILFIFIVFLSSWATSNKSKFQTMKDYYDYYEKELSEKKKQMTWTIGRIYPDYLSYDDVVRMNIGGVDFEDTFVARTFKLTKNTSNLPKTFDARKKWPNCQSISKERVLKDFNCDSEWALTAAATITDRICISSGGAIKHEVSALDILTCCRTCLKKNVCEGGDPFEAWKYWVNYGVVSGTRQNGCKPYHHLNKTKDCKQTCTNSNYKLAYSRDKVFGSRSFKFPPDAPQIQEEVMKNGPVQGIFKIYDDFFLHKAGVYNHVIGDFKGYGSVKVIGWGLEEGRPYWLVNKVKKEVSKKSLVFKLMKGVNHAGMIKNVVGGQAKTAAVKSVFLPGVSSSSKIFSCKFWLYYLLITVITY